jgi:hypothetical protein
VAEAYLAAVQDGRFDDAHGMLGDDFSEAREPAELAAFEQTVRQGFGSCEEPQLRGTQIDRVPGKSITVLNYLLSCQEAQSLVVFTIEKTNAGWVIQGVRYQDQKSAAPFECVACGTTVAKGARFCSNCGSPVDPTPGTLPAGVEPADAADRQ